MKKSTRTYYRKDTLSHKERHIKINTDNSIEIITFRSSKYEDCYKYSKLFDTGILKDYFIEHLPHSAKKDFDLLKNNLIKSMLRLK